MTIAAVVVSIIWFLVAFVLRIAIQRRTTGDSGVRANAGPPLSAGWWARVALVTSIVVVAVATVAAEPIGLGDAAALSWVGLVMAVAGIVATFWAQLRMGASWRIGVDPGERTRLVTTGMFGVVRNPIFTTMGVTAAGLVLMAPTMAGMAGLALLAAALELQVRVVEEPYLRATHGAAYTAYETAVGRFFPHLQRKHVE